jgi:8-oxo-dGTP pyrophosphatase MutT (NUDIX family)
VSPTEFEPLGGERKYEGQIASVSVERYRFADGAVVTREKISHPGAVGVLALDDQFVWLTRQPREVVGATASLEVPAGKLDVPGEEPLQAGKRELAEEIGKQAARWEEITSFWTSPGFTNERVWLYLATDLSHAGEGFEPDADERIEVIPWPLAELDGAIEQCEDSKSLIALLWLRSR